MRMNAEDLDFDTALALLDWQLGMGAGEAIRDLPLDRYALAERQPSQPPKPELAAPTPAPLKADPVAEARALAASAVDLPGLAAAMAGYEHCEIKRGARQLVFSDGNPDADVMIIGEAPGRDEDRLGRPFVGQAGQLLDRMLKAIGLNRQSPDPAQAVYITNVLPWRPPENRDPTPPEVAMMLPFLMRHIELAKPRLLVLVGNHSLQALTGKHGITRFRGQWQEAAGLPALPMLHPAYLLRQPSEKKRAWADLLSLRAELDAGRGRDQG